MVVGRIKNNPNLKWININIFFPDEMNKGLSFVKKKII
jgi:hypothetical protein